MGTFPSRYLRQSPKSARCPTWMPSPSCLTTRGCGVRSDGPATAADDSCANSGLPAMPAKMLTVEREGPFWDAVEGRVPLPPAAVTLGWELVSVSPEEGTIEVAFTAGEAFPDPGRVVPGGFLAALLDDTNGPAPGFGLRAGGFSPATDPRLAVPRPAPGRRRTRP